MPSERQVWQDVATENRVRIVSLEDEVKRLRERQHELASSVAAIRYMAEQVRELGEDVKELTGQVSTLGRRAMDRPSASVLGQWAAVIVAVIALVVAATH